MKDNNTIELKGEGYHIRGNQATLTFLSPQISITPQQGKNLALDKPKEQEPTDQDDVVKRESRLISAIIIEHWIPFELSAEVLKEAMPFFVGLGLYKDHWKSVDNCVGNVTDCYFDENNATPGINGWLCVDRKIDPLTAIRLEKGYVSRCSITFSFEWIQSHPEMKPSQFRDNIGEIIDNELVRLIVTKITSVTEVSLVYFGADPNAKVLSMQKNQNNDTSLEAQAASGTNIQKQEVSMDEKIRKLLEAALKKDIKTDLQLEQAVKDIISELAKLSKENEALESQVSELQAAKTFQDTIVSELRTIVQANATKVGSGTLKTRDKILIENADYQTLNDLNKDYLADLEKMFPLKCSNCGETSLSRRSSVEADDSKELSQTSQEGQGQSKFKTVHTLLEEKKRGNQ